jgi:hypothetical protein
MCQKPVDNDLFVVPIGILHGLSDVPVPTLHPTTCSRHRLPLLLDEPKMVGDVVGDPLQQDFQSQRPITRMTALPLEIF